jgi:hypothetical protein
VSTDLFLPDRSGLARMVTHESESDVRFFNLIHQITGSPPADNQMERRGRRRHPFICVQRIALCRNSAVLSQGDFFEVRCQDLNREGFSFLLPQPPDFNCLVAAFSSASDEIYMTATVSHWATVLSYPSGRVEPAGQRTATHGGRDADGPPTRMYQIGCRFTARVPRPPD